MSVMYVAVTNSRLGPYRAEVPAISARWLEKGTRLFTVVEKSFTHTARVDVSFYLRDYYLIKYIHGFSAGEFAYLATVQRRSHLRALEEWGYVTRLARVCHSDADFRSYAEISIQCSAPAAAAGDGEAINYNLLQAASVVRVGASLADSLRLEKGAQVLFGVFAASADHTMKLSGSSALCMFPLSRIEEKFNENIAMCYNGSVLSRNMDYIAGSVNDCPEPSRVSNKLIFLERQTRQTLFCCSFRGSNIARVICNCRLARQSGGLVNNALSDSFAVVWRGFANRKRKL